MAKQLLLVLCLSTFLSAGCAEETSTGATQSSEEDGAIVESDGLETPESDGLNPTLDTTEPEADVTEPEADVTEPEADVTEPEADVTEPEADVTEPEADVTVPEADVTEPEEDVTEPEEDVIAPEADVTEPEADVTEPEADVTEPEADVTEPEEDVTEPEADVTEPLACVLSLSEDVLSFDSMNGQAVEPLTVTLNAAPCTTEFAWSGEAVDPETGWLTVEVSSTTTPSEITIGVNPADLPSGGILGEIAFFSTDDGVDAEPVVLEVSVATTFTSWGFTGGPGVASVKALWSDPAQPSRVVAGATGGLFVSEDFGQQWTSVPLGGDAYSFQALDSTGDGSVVWVGTDTGIFRSDDGGLSWQDKTNNMGGLETWNGVWCVHVVDENRLYAGTARAHLSTDGGDTWTELAETAGGAQSIVELSDGTILVGTFINGIWRSTDEGASFTEVYPATGGGGFPMPSSVSDLIAQPDGSVLATDYSFFVGNATVLKSTNGGASWTTHATNVGGEIKNMAVDPSDSDRLFAASNLPVPDLNEYGLYKSENGGSSWSLTSLWKVGDVLSVAVDSVDSNKVIAGGSGAWTSTDGGWTFDPVNQGLGASTVSAVGDGGWDGRAYAGTPSQCLWHRENAESDWVQLPAEGLPCPSGISDVWVDRSNPDRLWVGIAADLYVSTDGGQTFSFTGLDGLSPFRILSPPQDPNSLYVACGLNGVYLSSDGGVTWEASPSNNQVVWIQELALSTNGEGSWLVAGVNTGDHLVRHALGTDSWEAIGTALPGIVKDVAVHPVLPDVMAVHVSNSGMFWTDDGGVNWAPAVPGIANGDVRRMVYLDGDLGLIGVATTEGFYLSTDHGKSYINLSGGLSPNFLRNLTVSANGHRLYGATVGGGVFEAYWSD